MNALRKKIRKIDTTIEKVVLLVESTGIAVHEVQNSDYYILTAFLV